MAWSGHAAGTAQYQQSPFANGQPGYSQQQPYPYGQQAGYGPFQSQPAYPPNAPPPQPPQNRPPKKKGNPIITRYPPPPGYRGPAQPQGPYGTNQPQNQYQPPQTQYPSGYSGAPSYPSQGYPAPQSYPPTQGYPPQGHGPPQNYPQPTNYPQQGYPQTQNYQYHQQPYPPNQGYSQVPPYQDSQSYAAPHPSYPGPTAQPAATEQQAYSQAQNWQTPAGPPPYPPNEQYGAYSGPPSASVHSQDANATPTPTSAKPATAQTTPTTANPTSATSERPQLFLAWDDWDFDFDGAIWPKSNEPVDPNLSLGVIIWRPAKQVTRALPSTFEEAEEQALRPPAEKLGNGESVSIYFTLENSHEAYLDVRQTDEWPRIRNDPVFVVFPDEKDMERIPIDECLSNRDRPDEPYMEMTEDGDAEMLDSSWNIMDNLEQALSGQSEDLKRLPPSQKETSSEKKTQEDVLAMLGVTGTPKPPSDEPIRFPFPHTDSKPSATLPEKPSAPPLQPIFQTHSHPENPPAPPQRAHSYGGHRNSTYEPPHQRPYGSMSSSIHRPPPPPPPPPPERPRYDLWPNANSHSQPNGHSLEGSRSPARSEASNRTLAGSDFEPEKPTDNATTASPPRSKLQRSDSSFSRKRSLADADQDDEQLRQQDDHTRRKRRQPQVADAYSRR